MPAMAIRTSSKEEESGIHSNEKMVNEDLQVDSEPPGSPYEETAFTSKHDDNADGDDGGQLSPVWAPLNAKGKKAVSRRVAEIHVDEIVLASPGVMTPITSRILPSPVTPDTSTPPMATSPIPSPVSTPTTALIQLTPVDAAIPISPTAVTPITARPSPTRSPPQTPIPITPVVPTSTTRTRQESEKNREHGRDRHHHRHHVEGSDERRKRKERERAKRERGSDGKRRSRPLRSDVEKEDTWLEVIFEDLPFGPDKNMVSTR